MIEFFASLLAGIISGMGMGGGTILILVLTLFLGMDQHLAQATNLIFFIPTSIIAIFINKNQNLIDLKTGIIVGGVGMIGSAIGALCSNKLNSDKLKMFFGIFLVIIALHEIYSYIKLYIKA